MAVTEKVAKLQEELTALGVAFEATATEAELKELLKEAKKSAKKNVVVFWLKSRAYVNDTQRVEAGLYKLTEMPERFKKLGADAIEIFEKDINSRQLARIAQWSGIDPIGADDEELFEKMVVTELVPF